MNDESETSQMIKWFNSLSFNERREKIASLKDFFDRNTIQLLKTVRNLESVENCPSDIIKNAKQLIANNMKVMSTLEKIEKGVDNAEKEINSQAVEAKSPSSGE
jgi:hypothetical protein